VDQVTRILERQQRKDPTYLQWTKNGETKIVLRANQKEMEHILLEFEVDTVVQTFGASVSYDNISSNGKRGCSRLNQKIKIIKSMKRGREMDNSDSDSDYFRLLPVNLVQLVFQSLDVEDLLQVAEVSRSFYEVSRTDLCWNNHKLRVLRELPTLAYFFNSSSNVKGDFRNRVAFEEKSPTKRRRKKWKKPKPNGIWQVFAKYLLLHGKGGGLVNTCAEQLKHVISSGMVLFAAAMQLHIPFSDSAIVSVTYPFLSPCGTCTGVRFAVKYYQNDQQFIYALSFFMPPRITRQSDFIYVLLNDGAYMIPSAFLFEPFIHLICCNKTKQEIDVEFGMKNDPDLDRDFLPIKQLLDVTYEYWKDK
jgi:hypothetical protein